MGLVAWWASLGPSMLPRSWPVQAAVSAICLGLGYLFGTLLGHLAHLGLRRAGWTPTPGQRRGAWIALGIAWAIAVVTGAVLWRRWQDDQRALVDLEPLASGAFLPMLVLTLVLSLLLWGVGRLVWRGVRALDRFNRRHLPGAVASPVTVVLVVVLAVVLLGNVALGALASWASSIYSTIDDGTNEGTEPPEAASVSGSPESLIAWDTLGVQGRDFVAGATTEDELAAFHGADADLVAPVRVYAGLRSAGSAEERAALAVEDLERAGGFERSVLVVATATGTGWVDPDAVEALEQVHGGDVATVSMQYSYLPSWISTLVDDGEATEAGAALFTAVRDRWSELPATDRPKLLVFGLSLGSYGAEAAFAGPDAATSVDNLVSRADGALFVGATSGNPILTQLTAERDPGSPAWLPEVAGGESVRFVNRGPDVPDLGPWTGPRILYVQHPSDPVTFWSADSLWSSPEWLDQPRGHDISEDARWVPGVTGIQGVFDLMAGFSAPPGFGHDYRLDYVDGWAQVAPPAGWTEADTARLEQHLTAE